MAIRIPSTTTAWSTAANWDTVTNTPTLHATTNVTITNSDKFTAAFTAPNLVNACTGVLFFCATTGTQSWTATLQEDTGSGFADTTSTGTLLVTDRNANSWLYFRFATSHVFLTTTANKYRFKLRTSVAGNGAAAADSGGTTIAFLATDNRTGVPASTDDIFVIGLNGVSGTAVVLTMDGTETIGSGSVTTVPIQRAFNNGVQIEQNGTLIWDTSASATLNIKGNVVVNNGGECDMGTVASPYPTSKIAKLIFTPTTSGDFGIIVFTTGKFIGQGEQKSSTTLWKTKYASGSGTTGSPLVTVDTTGWAVNDEIMIAATSNSGTNYNESENKFIKTIAGTSITLSDTAGGVESGLSFTHTTDAWILNLTRNVVITTNDVAKACYFNGQATTSGNVNFDWVRFENSGTGTAGKQAIQLVTVAGAFANCDYSVCYNSLSFGFFWSTSKSAQSYTGLISCNAASTVLSSYGFTLTTTANSKTFIDCFAIKNNRGGWGTTLTITSASFTRCYAISCNTVGSATLGGFVLGTLISSTFTDCECHCNRIQGIYLAGSDVAVTFENLLCGTKGTNVIDVTCVTDTFNNQFLFDNSTFGSATMISNYLGLSEGSEILFNKLNATANNHHWHNNHGVGQSSGPGLADTTTRTANSLSVRLAPEDAVTGFIWTFFIPCPVGKTASFIGYFMKNAAFGTDVAKVELWLPGSTSADDTFTLANNTSWQSFCISAPYLGSVDDLATVKVYAISATSAAYLYCDDFYNAGNGVTNSDPVTGLDTWHNAKPVDIIQPSTLSGINATVTSNFASLVLRQSTAQAGGNFTITLDTNASSIDEFYDDNYVVITAGTGKGQTRRISAYNGTTKVATCIRQWSTNPDSTSQFSILPFFSIPNAVFEALESTYTAAGTMGAAINRIDLTTGDNQALILSK